LERFHDWKVPILVSWSAASFRLTDARVPKECLDTYEELEEWKPYSDPESNTSSQSLNTSYLPRPAYAISTAQSLVALSEIIEQVIEEFYSIQSIKTHRSVLVNRKLEVHALLTSWRNELPKHLHFNPETDPTPSPHQITPQ
jgi:hypothetical protein